MNSSPNAAIAPNENLSNRGDATREALILTATEIFARDGFDATGTRAIAEAAKVNQALINYHFGNKKGLYHAVFEYIGIQVRTRLGDKITSLINAVNKKYESEAQARIECFKALMEFGSAFIEMMTSDESKNKAKLILREQQSPTEAFDIVYKNFMGPLFELSKNAILKIRPDLDDIQAKLLLSTIFGQMVFVRATRESLCRFMGWQDIGEKETEILKSQILENSKILLNCKDL